MSAIDRANNIHGMSPRDKVRLLQCVFCNRDPINCGYDEKDEDENGLCRKYRGTIQFTPERGAEE